MRARWWPSNNLAWIYAEAGENLDTALQLAQSAVAGVPNSPELQDTLGWVYYKKKQPLLAIPVLQQAVDKSPSQASYHYHLGLAYLQAGENDKGRAALQRALERGASGDDAADIRRLLAAPAASR
jgi:tetratricopeptide (TPR) repeat protein